MIYYYVDYFLGGWGALLNIDPSDAHLRDSET